MQYYHIIKHTKIPLSRRCISGNWGWRKRTLLPEKLSIFITVHSLNFFDRHVFLVNEDDGNGHFCPKTLYLYNGSLSEFFWTTCISGKWGWRKRTLLPEKLSILITVHSLNFFEWHVSLVNEDDRNGHFCPKNSLS